MVSVIMAAYGQAEYVAEALDSVIRQTYPNWEVIAVDDGSPDNVGEIVEEYARRDSRIKFFHTENNGVSAARNYAVGKSEGEFLLPLDADDIIEPEYMEKCVRHFQDYPETDVVYCQWRFFGSSNSSLGLNPYKDYALELIENRIFVSGVFRKLRFLEIGGYDEKMLTGLEDWEFWIRFLNEKSIVYMIPERLFNYRRKEVSRNTQGGRGLLAFENEMYILAKHKDKYCWLYGSPISSIRYKRKYYNIWYKRLWYGLFKKGRTGLR